MTHVDVASITRAALSSPSSALKRPLASLTFAANYLLKACIHSAGSSPILSSTCSTACWSSCVARKLLSLVRAPPGASAEDIRSSGMHPGIIAALIAAGWMLLPINLTAVLYVVQRMESLANLFVLLGLLGYLTARTRMLAGERGLLLCWMSLIVPTAIGALFKETAVMLPLYAFLIEWLVFRFGRNTASVVPPRRPQKNRNRHATMRASSACLRSSCCCR